MPEWSFHFDQPWWLLALLAIFPVSAWLHRSGVHGKNAELKLYADEHLLPHLTGTLELETRDRRNRLYRWALLWSLLTIAMAGPRWDFHQVQLFSPGADLVVLLDISRSMEVADVSPNRLTRARQELEDLVSQNRELRIGLIAFASVSHVIAPITEDANTIKGLLPHISTDLVRLQGSRLREALERARQLLAAQPKESQHSILLISDGDFVEEELLQDVEKLSQSGTRFHVLGIGSEGGGPIPNPMGGFLTTPQGAAIESRLESTRLAALAKAGSGIYLQADFRDEDTSSILEAASEGGSRASETQRFAKIWNERFYLLIFIAMALLLTQFRRTRVWKGDEQ